jgi:hypothetical protein
MDPGRRLVLLVVGIVMAVAIFANVAAYSEYGTERIVPQVGRLALTIILGVLLVFGLGWARWIAVVVFVFFGVTTSGGGLHFLRHGEHLVRGTTILASGLLYLASAAILVFSPSVRAWFRSRKALAS